MEKSAMEKLAYALKLAEVEGACMCLRDAKLLKVANDEELALVADAIAEELGDDYTEDDLLEAAAKANEILEGSGEAAPEEVAAPAEEYVAIVDPEEEKVASDKGINVRALQLAFGELTMSKEAGQITEEEYMEKAAGLKEILTAIGSAAGNATGAVRTGAANAAGAVRTGAANAAGAVGKFTGLDDLAKAVNQRRRMAAAPGLIREQSNESLKSGLKTLGKNVVLPTGLIGAGAGGQALYERYANE